MMEKQPAQLGEKLFLAPDEEALSRGTKACQDWFLTDFLDPACDMIAPHHGDASLRRALGLTQDFIKEMVGLINQMRSSEAAYPGSVAGAKGAAANICSVAEREGGETGERKKAMAEKWLKRELQKIDFRRDFAVAAAKRRCVTAGKKLSALYGHLRNHGLLSSEFESRLETWQVMDATQLAALQGPCEGETQRMLKQSSKFDEPLAFEDTQVDDHELEPSPTELLSPIVCPQLPDKTMQAAEPTSQSPVPAQILDHGSRGHKSEPSSRADP